jgi:uncharacterized protein YdaU (DUF1376 family)
VQKTLVNQPVREDNETERSGAETPTTPLTDTLAAKDSDDMADADSTPGKSPAFQFYPKDFITDERVTLMSMQERGVYITLICKCWTEGTLPADPVLLSRLCGFPTSAFRKCWIAIAPCFRPCSRDASRLIHPRLEKERQKQRAYRRRQADNGKLGGRPPKPKPNPSLSQKPAETQPMVNPSQSSAFASSSSSSDFSQKQERVRVFPPPRDKSPSEVSDDTAERAGRFCERYAELYAQCRKGARYLGRPALDFQEALTLVQTWSDARLEQLARAFLTTDHEFAEKGSRTMAQFRAMASWCDSQLIEAGIA